ncbi:MAG: hypothetical protein OXC93_09915 [Rhodospirillaceae bacterium]|nr:hypothetical protein [Rhodospirillaceae bacterium]
MKMTVEFDDGLARVPSDHVQGARNDAPSLDLLPKDGGPVPGVDRRVVFRFEDGNAVDVDLIDDH